MAEPADLAAVRAEVAATARRVVAAGLIGAFGHVSSRLPDGEGPTGGIAITSTRPLARTTPDEVLVVDAEATPVAGPVGDAPLERVMHLAIYAARPDVGAICRGHPAAAVAWGAGTRDLPLLHGLGAMAGRRVAVHHDIDLITTVESGRAVAATLGDDHAVLLRSNGGLAVGATLDEAATRLWYVEERAAVALAAPDAGKSPAPAADWEPRWHHVPAELRRAVAWFRATHDVPLGPAADAGT
ncbi:MAG: class II aldolase/adducin family protein [Actinomycetota bacterium]|nr:class II aldolase/adducin family protein [Actinomycetota bacterium]